MRAVALGLAVVGCATAPPPTVGYAPAGEDGSAVFLVEQRTGNNRHYLIMCRGDRIPPCARIAPQTLPNVEALQAWADTEPERARASAQPASATQGRRIQVSVPPTRVVGERVVVDATGATVVPRGAPDPRRPGTVRIVTPGGWANVYTAGRFLGQTPLQVEMSPGSHTLSFRPFGQPTDDPPTVSVDVTSDETTAVVLRDFGETAAPGP